MAAAASCLLVLLCIGLSVMCKSDNNTANFTGSKAQHAIARLKDAVANLSSYMGITVSALPPKCMQATCQLICFNGQHNEISNDIANAMANSEQHCETIAELRLFNYAFPNKTIPVGFLGAYGDKIEMLSIGYSSVEAIEPGAFGTGKFRQIFLEELQLQMVDKDFFKSISNDLKEVSIVQRAVPLPCIYPNFLEHVKFQINKLVLNVGIVSVRNVTATDPVLGTLTDVEFSHNDFSDQLLIDSFIKLTMVERLVLSHSKISFLPSYIFFGMIYLEYLDISYNMLHTITRDIFGFQEMSQALIIEASHNNWHCDCPLLHEMNAIFVHHTAPQLICVTPEMYKEWSVFNEEICDGTLPTSIPPSYDSTTTTTTLRTTTMPIMTTITWSTTTTTTATSTTTTEQTRVPSPPEDTTTEVPTNNILLECLAVNHPWANSEGKLQQYVSWPELDFNTASYAPLSVKISVEAENDTDIHLGLFWFSTTSRETYLMELETNEFGCYVTIPLQTIVQNLTPNVAYTFCLISSQQTTISPFSCKSMRVDGNLKIQYSAGLSRSMPSSAKVTLIVFGVVVFIFLGILSVFLVLKRKPVWLKGSKRVMQPKNRSGEIIVLPRGNSVEYMRNKERMLLRNKMQRLYTSSPRRNSTESLTSTNSYMSANLYEVIPAYLTFDKAPETQAPTQPTAGFQLYDDASICWESASLNGSTRYVKIPPRTKRISSDPLPALPVEAQQTLALTPLAPQLLPAIARHSEVSAEYIMAISSETITKL